jgi:prepilin peptidase CpaA
MRAGLLMASNVFFASLLVVACGTDWRRRRIPNPLVALLASSGLFAVVFTGGLGALWGALLSGLVGLACWLPLWLFGAIGAGDVKLFAAASVWLAAGLAWRAALVAAVLGGLLAVAYLPVRRRRPGAPAADSTRRAPSASAPDAATIPYALPMVGALLLARFAPTLLQRWL